MKAQTLYRDRPNGIGIEQIKHAVCGICGRIWNTEKDAEKCCRCLVCQEPLERGDISYHPACRRKQLAEIEAKRRLNARGIPPEHWTGPVFSPQNDEYYENVRDAWHDGATDDGYVYACTIKRGIKIDMEDIAALLEDQLADEESASNLNGWRELKLALGQFMVRNSIHEVWHQDCDVVIEIPAGWGFDEEDEGDE